MFNVLILNFLVARIAIIETNVIINPSWYSSRLGLEGLVLMKSALVLFPFYMRLYLPS